MTDELKILIQLYFDNELEKSKEPYLFAMLSRDEESRKFFKNLNTIKTAAEQLAEQVPFELEERIFKSLQSSKGRTYFSSKPFAQVSFALSIILLALSFLLFSSVNNYKKDIETMARQVEVQNESLKLLFNSLPPAEVIGSLKNKIVIQANL